ncbi:hypothetical protein WA026_000704 [Henosepilachna vigintioctopunctata]|uniref:Uncharacterized protein n=1 Tax=Henosepilachna vigintioctopunctata TaxID=420089 RepID=A0AAW1UZC1_9CUCU
MKLGSPRWKINVHPSFGQDIKARTIPGIVRCEVSVKVFMNRSEDSRRPQEVVEDANGRSQEVEKCTTNQLHLHCFDEKPDRIHMHEVGKMFYPYTTLVTL